MLGRVSTLAIMAGLAFGAPALAAPSPVQVEAAVKALKGEKLPKIIDTGFYYYDKANMADPKIAAVLYD